MVPLGTSVPEPPTINATDTGVLTKIELLAGATVTVGVVLAGAPPFPLEPVLPLLPDEDEPQPIAMKAMAIANMEAESISFHFRVQPGTKKIRSARTADPPAALNHFESPKDLGCRLPDIAAVVLTETLPVPVVTVELRKTEEPAAEQVGRLVAPAGEEVSTQLSVMAPVYPLLPLTVTTDVADAPGAIAGGLIADSVKVGGTTAVTTTLVVPVADA
jgi:hypothetical protein